MSVEESIIQTAIKGNNEKIAEREAESGRLETELRRLIVTRNAFKGMSPAVAARTYLQKVGRPQTHAEVANALLMGSVMSASRRPADSFRTSMQRHPKWFRWTKKNGQVGTWALVEWQLAKDSSSDDANQAPETPQAPPRVGQTQLSV